MSESTATEPAINTGPTGPTPPPESTTEPAINTGPTGPEPVPESTTESAIYTGPTEPEPVPLVPISLADILSAIEVVQQKEATDKSLLEGIGSVSTESLRPLLIQWALRGFPSVFPIMEVVVVPPPQCSDGVTRGLTSYITFCSGKTMHEHVDILQQKLAGISVSFANMGSHIAIVVSKT